MKQHEKDRFLTIKREAFLRACEGDRRPALLPNHGMNGGYTTFNSAKASDVTVATLEATCDTAGTCSLDSFNKWEFAIDDVDFSNLFATFPHRYFDPELPENVVAWRQRMLYGGPAELRPEFQWNLEYNFFSPESVREMSVDLTAAANAVSHMIGAFGSGVEEYRVGSNWCAAVWGWMEELAADKVDQYTAPPWAVEAWCREVAFRLDMMVEQPGSVLTVFGP